MCRNTISLILLLLLGACGAKDQGAIEVPTSINDTFPIIAHAQHINIKYGDQIWPGISKTKFSILLVGSQKETLLCHEGLATGFNQIKIPGPLNCQAATRTRVFSPNFLATFPAVDGVATIVVGTPKATHLSAPDWELTLLHEHFHQMQMTRPNYYRHVNELDLSGGDETGMWMLNYPFPYTDEKIVSAFTRVKDTIIDALQARQTPTFSRKFASYWNARESFRRAVSEKDWRYFEFQLWQEGVARWTELQFSKFDEPLFGNYKAREAKLLTEINTLDITQDKRVVIYALGAAEALLLDAQDVEWRQKYWDFPFSMRKHFEATLSSPNK